MHKKIVGTTAKALGAGLILLTAMGCMSKEERIKEVIVYEIEKCKAADGEFYEVETHDENKHRVLTELCHLEPSDVVMNNEFTGTLSTGPLQWTGGEDQETRAMVLTRVAWEDFDRALRYRGQNNLSVSDYRAAENNFELAQNAFPQSTWLRIERLQNLLDMRAEVRSEDENPATIGEEARDYFDSVIEWATEEENRQAEVRARLAVLDHLGTYRDRQRRSLGNLGSRDSRMESVIKAAEEEGDSETAETYRAELEERRERRPAQIEEIEGRIQATELEMCELRSGLSVSGIEDNSLRSRITSALGAPDCDLVAAAAAKEESEEDDE